MANFKIMRNGLNTEIVGDPHIGQSSEDVTVAVTDDGTYQEYDKKLYYSYGYRNQIYRAIADENSSNEFVIPMTAFLEPGIVKLSLELSNGTNKPTCNACFIISTEGAKSVAASDILPDDATWEKYVESYVKSHADTLKGAGFSTEVINKLEEVGNYLAYTTADGRAKWTELITILRNGSSGETPAVYGQPLTDKSLLKMTQQNTAILGVKLDTKPTQNQTISILSDSNAVTFDKEILEFTSANWNEYQFVTITAGMIDNDTSVNIILRNSDELLTDKNITVYILADSYAVDTTIPTEDQHILTSEDFEGATAVNGYGILLKKYTGEYTNVKVPSSMKYNGETYTPVIVANCFKENTAVKYVEFEDGTKFGGSSTSFSIGQNSGNSQFYGCTSLIGVKNIPSTTVNLANCFKLCSSLKFVTGIDDLDLSHGGNDALFHTFENCTSLEYVQDLSEITTNRETGTTDGINMFYGCTSLKKVYGLPQLTNMTDCFSGCTSLEEGFVPTTVGTYGETTNANYGVRCFAGCVNLKKITVLTEVATPDLPTSLNNNCIIYAIEGSPVYSGLQSKIASLPTATLLPYGSNAEGGNIVTAWGDSTTSYNNNWIDWVQRLGKKLDGFTMKNQAVSGEYTTSTSARQGGNTLKVGAFTIPADTTSVQITLSTKDGHTFGTNPVFSGGASFNPCVVNGVKGTIANAGSGKYTFTRLEAGSETQVEENTIVTSVADTVFNNKNSIMLINLGTNSGWDENADVLLNQVQLMVNHFTSMGGTKYIICGLSSGKHLITEAFKQASFEYEEKASSAFGEHWLNMREYLIENGLTENGLTASTLDNERIAQGLVPASLLGGGSTTDIKMYDGETVIDQTHFNCYGANSQSLAFYNKGKALGYWD